jgi:hypothetical protein
MEKKKLTTTVNIDVSIERIGEYGTRVTIRPRRRGDRPLVYEIEGGKEDYIEINQKNLKSIVKEWRFIHG